MVADKIKSCLPALCLDFVLTAEKGERLECDKLSEMVDAYYASRPKLSNRNDVVNSNVTNPKSWNQFKQFNVSENASPISSSETAGKVASAQSQTAPVSGKVKRATSLLDLQ